MQFLKIRSIKPLGRKTTLDLEVNHPDHNFYAEGIVTSNSHSLATSMTSALTTYLKYKYPLQFYWSCLCESKSQSGRTPQDEVSKVQREMHNFGISLLPPDLVRSDIDFKMEDGNIRYGLGFIKGISEKTIEKLQMFRSKERPNKIQMFNAMKESGLQTSTGCALIQAGCLSSLENNRPRLVLELQTYLSSAPGMLSDRERNLVNIYAAQFNYDVLATLAFLRDNKDENGKPFIKPDRWKTFLSKYNVYKEIWEQNRKNEAFANYVFEKALLGFSYSGTLISVFGEAIHNLMPLDEIGVETTGIRVRGIGTVVKKITGTSKKKNPYLKLLIADDRGEINLMAFNEARERIKESGFPEENDIVTFDGTKKDGNTVFASNIVIQDQKVFMKIADLKKLTKEEKNEDKS